MEFFQAIKQEFGIGQKSESLQSMQYSFEETVLHGSFSFPSHANPGTETLTGFHSPPSIQLIPTARSGTVQGQLT